MVKNTVISQLQSVSEGALGKFTQSSATRSAAQAAMQLKDRGDRILRGLESIEERLTAIEKRLGAIEAQVKKPATTRRRSSSSKTRSTAPESGATATNPGSS
jgi:hypothetical protein